MRSPPTWPLPAAVVALVCLEVAAGWVAHPHWVHAHWLQVVDVVGVCATVAAAFLAWIALLAIRRERRVDFHLEQLVAIGQLLTSQHGSFGKGAPLELGIRVSLLP